MSLRDPSRRGRRKLWIRMLRRRLQAEAGHPGERGEDELA
jgi:hypothetical protein